MTGIAELHAQALEETGRVVRRVVGNRWQAATPRAGWDARTLVNHLVSGNLRAAELAAGATIENVGSRFDGDVFIHGWDLAATTGQDTRLDADLMQACREVIEPQLQSFRDAGAQARFLGMLGRAG